MVAFIKLIIFCVSLVFILFASGEIHAAVVKENYRNGVYVEYYGITHAFSSGKFSINYERVLGKKENKYLRAGIYPDFRSTVSVPITFTWITSPNKRHHFEYGLGFIFRMEHFENNYYRDIPAAIFPFMYRYQRKSGLFLRAGFNLFYSWPVLLSPGVSLGYKF